SVSGSPQLAFVNLEWNDLEPGTLSHLNFLQRVNLANNQLSMLDVTFDPMLTYLNISNNPTLNDLRTMNDDALRQVVGENWSDFD
ncbi:MAG: hypothetical protein K2M67_07955, partial [Muribaculaceae bacterium]|nr:hypothetical protein [Muribaculaceae bacterium]